MLYTIKGLLILIILIILVLTIGITGKYITDRLKKDTDLKLGRGYIVEEILSDEYKIWETLEIGIVSIVVIFCILFVSYILGGGLENLFK